VEISIDFAGRSHAAFGRRLEATAYLLDFLARQITSASANQHSVLVIHGVSPFIIGSVERARVRQKQSLRRECLYIGAALAHESISVRAGVFRSRGGAKGCGTYSATDVLDFLLTQGTSALAKQYSVQVIHTFISFGDFGPSDGPSYAEVRLRWAQPNALNSRLHQRADLHPERDRRCTGKGSESLH